MITTTCFGGRSISKILVHPTDSATIFVSTATGISGIGANAISNLIPPLGLRGVYRSTNATAAPGSVTFTKLVVADQASLDSPGTGNTSIFDMVMEPGTPANLLVSVAGASAPGGGVFRSTNALDPSPTFTQTLTPGFTGLVMTLAINKVGSTVTAYVASNEPSSAPSGCGSQSGRVRKSTDGGATWSSPLTAAEGYCGSQCAYDNPVGVDPNDANIVYLGGNARGTCSDVLKRSSDGGTTFVRDDTGLHADGHNFAFDTLTTPTTVWFVTDGGVFKRQDAAAGTAWSNQNNGPLSTVQFQSLAVHPTDQFFMIGGTQDNGTEAQTSSNGNWVSAESGDGGFALIDQSATDTTNVTMYHTFFNVSNSLIGFDRTNLGACLAQKDSWEFRGFGGGADPTPSCDGTAFAASNGISGSDAVLFYAPMALGPGTPNTLYFGTDRLYRSNDKGDTMTVVSQAPFTSGVAISAIGVADALGSPGVDDLIRVVGLRNGSLFVTTTGGNPLTDASFPIPNNANNSLTNKFISRVVIDRTNPNIAYVTLAYYTNPGQQQVWRTANLNAATPTWTVIQGSGLSSIPNIPINAFVIDPLKPSRLFAGTDIGVYVSENSGSTWSPYGQGLPRAAVFDMAIQPTSRLLRVATHGRGMWEIDLFGPTAAPASISGAVMTATGLPLAGVAVHLKDGLSRTTTTDNNGRYHFDEVKTGDFYTVTPELANYSFTPGERSFSLLANKSDAVYTAIPDAIVTANAIDTTEYFVRQQYIDFLEREPDQGGFDYWTERINECGMDAACVRARRIDVAAAFFVEREFQETGSFIYRLYRGALGRRLSYAEFSSDRPQVVGGPNLEASKTAFIERFVEQPDFVSKYQRTQSAESFVTALLQTISAADADLSGQRTNLISLYNSGSNLNQSRSLVLRAVADNADFARAVYNDAFVLMEYFGYLRRDPDQRGYDFWLDVVTSREPGNYRGMVCAFITSTEYQLRFSSVVTRSNADCSR